MTTAQARDLPERWDAVLEHRDRALRVARARLNDPHDVDDCVQEGMTRVVAMPELDLGRVGPLLSTVVANVAADTHRSRIRSARLRAKLTWSQVEEASHDDPVCDAAEARWLLGALDQLSERERAVLEHRAAGRSVAETAAALGISYKAVDSAYTRARNAVKAVWRATLGVTALSATAHSFRRSAPAAVAVTLAAALSLAVGVLHPATGAPAQSPIEMPSVAMATQTTHSAWQRAARPATAAGDARTSATAQRPPTVEVVVAPSAHLPEVRKDRTTVTREHGEESFAQTVERCVRKGLVIRPDTVRCNE